MKRMILVLALVSAKLLFAQTATVPSGTGTSGDPYLISTLNNLYWIADQVANSANDFYGKYFSQTADIDASSTSTWDNPAGGTVEGWLPIGNGSTNFSGRYDGNWYKIDGLYINRGSDYKSALFGITYSATISNLGVTNVNIQGYSSTGALIGWALGSNIITNCYSSGTVAGTDQNTGGLIGNVSNSTVSQCYSTASVTETSPLGGLIGKIQNNASVSNCYATGSVSCSNGLTIEVGGLIGYNYDNSSVSNCYSTGQVVLYSYGGLVGSSAAGGTVNNSFWDTETSGRSTSSGGTGKTTLEMKDVATFTNTSTSAGLTNAWDFVSNPNNDAGNNDYWDIKSAYNTGYPFLSWQSFAASVTTQSVTSITASTATGNGNVTDLGYPNPTQHGVCWNTTGTPTVANNKTEDGAVSVTGAFTSAITGLTVNTKYYVRAYVTNNAGTSYGTEVTFITYPGSGIGTSGDPYQVASLDNLRAISENSIYWDKYFIQTADIDASATTTWNSDGEGGYYGWSPIGNDITPFTGSYNGDGHVIDQLYIANWGSRCGFFGDISGASVSNVGFTQTSINDGTSFHVGGIAGTAQNSSQISNCFVTGSISSGGYSGGIVGSNDASTISNCYSRASVSADDRDLGGIVGTNSGTISNCYSTGLVSGNGSPKGGLVGNNSGTVTNSFWDTETSGQATSAGGTGKTTAEMKTQSIFTDAGWDFVGETTNGTNDYWRMGIYDNDGYPFLSWKYFTATVTTQAVTDITSTTATGNGNITSLGNPTPTQHGVCWNSTGIPTTADNKTEDGAVAATGAFTSSITSLASNTKYYVRAYTTNNAGTSYGSEVSFTTFPGSGAGTSGNPFQVSSLECLSYITQHSAIWNKYFIQTVDIDASSTQYWDNADDDSDGNLFNDTNDGTSSGNNEGWSSIGNSTTKFTGSYNGQSYKINGVTISRGSANYIGFFGYTLEATITNIGFTNVDIEGSNYVGALVGLNDNTDITNCYATGTVSGDGRIGGLLGENDNSIIEKSYSTASVVSSGNYYGGFTSTNSNSTINNCYATGSVTGLSSYVGGFVGSNSNSTIDKCYSTGLVTGNFITGGLVGSNSLTVSNSFWDTQTSGRSTSSGGEGKTTELMKTQSTFTDAGWDFEIETTNGTNDYWDMDYSGSKNNGYPYLSWEDGGDVSLSVELASFSARCEGQSVVLEWVTESELDNLGFILERSEDDKASWQVIASYRTHDALKGQGNTSSRTEYVFTDNNVEPVKEYFYSLFDVNTNGEITQYVPLSIQVDYLPETTAMENAYPNPFNPQTYIAYHLAESADVNISVFDLLGRRVRTLYAGQQPAGSYHVYWHGTDDTGIRVSSEGYFILMETKNTRQVQKVMMVK